MQNNHLLKEISPVMEDYQDALHEGRQFKKFVKSQNLTLEEVASKLEVTRQAVFLQMRRPFLSANFKRKLISNGYYPFKTEEHNYSSSRMSGSDSAKMDLLKQEIKRLQTIVALQAEHIREISKLNI